MDAATRRVRRQGQLHIPPILRLEKADGLFCDMAMVVCVQGKGGGS
jgi:hypothetical protein